MPAVVIVGAQWGDEGKGKVVDLYTDAADLVVRFAGGPNAGHTLVVGEETLVVRLVPSGILRREAQCVMAQGMVVDPAVLLGETDTLASRGYSTRDRLFLSDRAHLILPYHIAVDGLREAALAAGRRIGTTKRGIGPCYEDKAARRGVRAGDIIDSSRTRALVEAACDAWAPVLRALGGSPIAPEPIVEELARIAPRIAPMLRDASALVDDAARAGKRILLEGAQGTLLDIDHGTYPFVTSSSAVAGGACTGAGIGPSRISRVVGLTKAYATRVGSGPFPTELFDDTGEHLRRVGNEFGSVTGRPRRTGWLDLPALRYAARVNGLDGLVVTKLDVLTRLRELRVCVAYETASGRTRDLPMSEIETATPVFETLEGWDAPLDGIRRIEGLPAPARAYLDFLERGAGVPIDVVSVGPRRDETIVLRDAFPS